MKTWRKWFLSIAIVAGTIVSVAYKQYHAREEYLAQSQADCVALAHSPEEKHSCEKEAQSHKDYAHWWHILLTWPEGITAWALIATLFVIAWQSNETRRAAEAALKQADHMVASERAWLTAQVMDFPEPHEDSQLIWIPIPITNRGKTPARIDSIVVTSQLVPIPETSYGMPGKLPETPDYADGPKVIALEKHDIIIGPDDTFNHMHAYIHPKEWEDVKAKKLTLYVYGFIDYFDTLKGLRHRTAFCSIYWRTDPKYNEPTGFMFSPIIPADYFRAT